jgi:cytochrome c2
MDWQHFYSGAMLFPIKMKMVFAGLLLLLLILAHVFNRKQKIVSHGVFFLYGVCLLAAVGLGYFGGELVYGSKSAKQVLLQGPTAMGADLFQQNCSACHFSDSTADKIGPGLKGVFKQPKFPASGRPTTEKNFRSLLVQPLDSMPPFGHLTEEEVSDLIAFLKTL